MVGIASAKLNNGITRATDSLIKHRRVFATGIGFSAMTNNSITHASVSSVPKVKSKPSKGSFQGISMEIKVNWIDITRALAESDTYKLPGRTNNRFKQAPFK
jgi:hypothetical protein